MSEFLVTRNSDGDFVIGMELAHSIESIVVLLAVLKAGAASLSVDDGHPDDRVNKIISQGQPAFVIVEKG